MELIAIAASMMLGSGIFFTPAFTAQEFPDSRMILLLWGLGGLVALAGALAFGRLGALFPFSGGPYVYVREAYGPWCGFLFSWTSFTIIAPTSMAVVATVFAAHLGELSSLSRLGLTGVSLWALAAVTFANTIGVKTGGRVQTVLTGLKILLVALLIALLFGATGGPPAPDVAGGGRLSIAFAGVLFAVGGWEYAVLASEEVRDPKRTIPRALLIGTAIVVALYLFVILAYLALLGPDGMARSPSLAPDAADQAWSGSSRLVAIAVAISALGTLNAIVLLGPRATFAVSRDGLVPAVFARVSRRWATPVTALLAQVGVALAFFFTGTAQTVAAYTVVGTGVFIILSAVALPKLRVRAGAAASRMDGVENAAGYFVALAYLLFLGGLVWEDFGTAAVGLGLVLLGFLPYGILRATRGDFRPGRLA